MKATAVIHTLIPAILGAILPTAHARVVAVQPNGGEPSKESQIILNNLWTSVHGEEKPRPVVKAEKTVPKAPSFNGMFSGEGNKFLKAAEARVKGVATGGGSGGSLLASFKGDKKDKKKKDEGLLGTLKSAGKAAQKGGDLKAELKRAKDDLLDIQQWNDFAKGYYAQWKKDKAEYLKNLVAYKSGLIKVEVDDKYKAKKKMEGSTKPLDKEIHVISGSLDVPVRNQEARGTCASFTGSRVMEIVLKQNGLDADLSEQYFYWSSKPKCQTSKCNDEGSWFFQGFEYSVNAGTPNIPLEKDCPYNPKKVAGNDTQIPLKDGCAQGYAKVRKYEILKDTYDQVVDAIKANRPVAAAYYLSENFFDTSGIVTNRDAQKSNKEHAGGHAIVLTGYMALPEKYWAEEGKVCFITANSWGKGWGVGGYSCLTERWMQEHAISYFTVVEEMEVI
jgi:hypothetical protein